MAAHTAPVGGGFFCIFIPRRFTRAWHGGCECWVPPTTFRGSDGGGMGLELRLCVREGQRFGTEL